MCFLQNLRINMEFTHLSSKFYTTFSPQMLKFYILISIDHLYWNLCCFIVGKISPYLRTVCDFFGTKIWSCKIIDTLFRCLKAYQRAHHGQGSADWVLEWFLIRLN